MAGARGRMRTTTYKVSATFGGGFRSVASSVIAGYDAAAKARRTGEAVLKRVARMLDELGLPPFGATALNVIGDESLYGGSANAQRAPAREVVLRLAVQHARPEAVELFSKEYVGTGLSMTTGRCGIEGGRPSASPMVKLFSFLIDKARVPIVVKLDGAPVAFAPVLPPAGHIDHSPRVASPAGKPFAGRMVEAPLIALAVARSGDKGADANIGIIARKPEYMDAIRASLTPEAVKSYFAHLANGGVERYELPGVHALNFMLRDSLGGGGTSSVRLDVQAKTYGQLLLSIPVRVPEAWGNELGVA